MSRCGPVPGPSTREGPVPGPSTRDGPVSLELRGHSVRALAGEIAGLGGHLEVLDPPELRDQLAAIGAELSATYGAASGQAAGPASR